jgi:hypothetical protein
MKIEMDVPSYVEHGSLVAEWDPAFEIAASVQDGEVVIRANTAGLRSLARHLLCLADEGVPPGHHFHFDDSNSLEDGSASIIIERM